MALFIPKTVSDRIEAPSSAFPTVAILMTNIRVVVLGVYVSLVGSATIPANFAYYLRVSPPGVEFLVRRSTQSSEGVFSTPITLSADDTLELIIDNTTGSTRYIDYLFSYTTY